MALRYVTLANIRAASGIDSTLISDVDFISIGEYIEYEIEDKLNSKFIPTTIIEQYNGSGIERLILNHRPILKLRALTIDDTAITPQYVRIDKQPAIIWLTTDAELPSFRAKTNERNLVRIKYDYATMDLTTTNTTTTAATTAGTSVSIAVSSSTSFIVDDYVEIQGMDSQREVGKITELADSTHITVDTLSTIHESGSLVTKIITPKTIERLIILACALGGVARIVGSTFDEITGYTIEQLHVQKGEPYTQWRETALQLRREYDSILENRRPSLSMGLL